MGKGIRFFLLLQCMIVFNTVFGQAIAAFNDSTSTWYVARSAFIGSPTLQTETRTLEFTLPTDTLIAGVQWRGVQEFDHGSGLTSEVGYVRQSDSLGLFLSPTGVLDTIYDYSFDIGDTMYVQSTGAYHHVVRVDSILLQGASHKRIWFDTLAASVAATSTDVWIEGIGSIYGPLAPSILGAQFTDTHSFPDSTRLSCFENSIGLALSNPDYPGCVNNILLAVTELDDDTGRSSLSIYPNPGQEVVGITRPTELRTGVFQVYDMQGKRLHAQQVTRTGSAMISYTTHELPPGMYQLIITGEQGAVWNGKWIKE